MNFSKRTYTLIVGAFIAGLLIVISPLAMFGNTPESWLLSARYTARLAFVLFLVPFVIPKWRVNFGDAATADSLLAFATTHTVHLGALITYLAVSSTPLSPVALGVGGMAYALMFGLVVILIRGGIASEYRVIALHYILLVFALTYAGRLSSDDTQLVGVAGVGFAVLALVLRHLPRFTTKRNA